MLTHERTPRNAAPSTQGHGQPPFFDRDGLPYWDDADREDGYDVLSDLHPAFNTCHCQEYEVEEGEVCLGCETTNILGF